MMTDLTASNKQSLSESESRKYDRERAHECLVPLANADPTDSAHLGGKAANLARLIQSGLRVPEGYIIPTDIFDEVTRTGEFPDIYIDDIMQAIDELGGSVAIRSSANVEDGDSASLAWRIRNALRHQWRSQYSNITYRRHVRANSLG